jgi:hypothetical protein
VSINPEELELVEREEHEARLRLGEARERQLMNEARAPAGHTELLRRLEADWQRALERLHRAREAAERAH